jgi:hypothetical protein
MGKIRVVGPVINQGLEHGIVQNPKTKQAGPDFYKGFWVL